MKLYIIIFLGASETTTKITKTDIVEVSTITTTKKPTKGISVMLNVFIQLRQKRKQKSGLQSK